MVETMKRVLDVGNCDLDHGNIARFLQSHFAVQVVRARLREDALAALRAQPVDLVLVNRLLDEDGSEGLDVIRQIKADPQLAHVPCMLISNYPHYQEAAVAAGAEYGFGKKELDLPQTQARLAKFLLGEGSR
jgi:CheY-like chemotaxis protein